MPVGFRRKATLEEISGSFEQFVETYDGHLVQDTIKFPATFLRNATPEQLESLGIETFEIVLPDPEPSIADKPAGYPLQPFQFYAMLEIMGKRAAVDIAIDQIADPTARIIAKVKFEKTQVFRREDALFNDLAPVVGLTDAQIDAAWMQAKDIA